MLRKTYSSSIIISQEGLGFYYYYYYLYVLGCIPGNVQGSASSLQCSLLFLLLLFVAVPFACASLEGALAWRRSAVLALCRGPVHHIPVLINDYNKEQAYIIGVP